jgi:hypothetical protein
MAIVALNERSSLPTVRGQGRIRILNPTSRTLPKAGKNGTASLFSGTMDAVVGRVPTKEGNAFGNNAYANRTAKVSHEKSFGQRANVAIATGAGSGAPNYVGTDGAHPNAHFFDVARQPKRAPTQPGSPNENGSAPAGVFKNQGNQSSTVMPHQRNGIGANQGKNLSKRATFRSAAGGANKSLPSDTPFHKMAVRRAPSVAQTTGVPNPPDTSSHHYGKVSFGTRSNLWYDPNNSFAHGATSTGTGRSGTGRWNIVKRGAAG